MKQKNVDEILEEFDKKCKKLEITFNKELEQNITYYKEIEENLKYCIERDDFLTKNFLEKSYMMKRTFHPVGHGGFYSEEFKNFKLVYDCGSKSSLRVKEVIKNNFTKDETIDILFISHFDSDHVNGIPALNEHCNIKQVVMPLLHENTKIALTKLYKIYEPSLVSLIENPKEFFGENTKIIYVKPNNEDNNRIDLQRIDPQPIELETITDDLEIDSNTILKSQKVSMNNWIFIPYNDEHKDRKKELKKIFDEFTIDIEKLEKDSNYTLKMIDIDSKKTLKYKEKFKKIYDRLTKKINENSMLLYSGRDITTVSAKLKKKSLEELMIGDRVASLYTGDSNLNKINIKEIFNPYWGNIGTIQIPHHGSKHNFNENILSDDKSYYCPISVPNESTNHPNIQVTESIQNNNSIPLNITYDEDEILQELRNKLDCWKKVKELL